MGAGKSAIGKELARLLARDFFDSDREIERRSGADITLIFDKEGEAGFRRRERQVIEELTARDHVVLATGGGAVLDPANRDCLRTRGCVVYLKTSVAAQIGRTGRGRQRPLLETSDRAGRVRELFAVREPLYESIARITVSTDHGHVKTLALHILRELEEAAARKVM